VLHRLKRHPIPIQARFRHCLVLTYAFPVENLQPLLPPGLTVDEWNGAGFVAVALVQTERLRPVGLPAALGSDFFLTGYRVFATYRTAEGRTLRGLRILRSDANKRRMVWGGNLLTHYQYRLCEADVRFVDGRLDVRVRSGDRQADIDLTAHVDREVAEPPAGIFSTWKEARRFAGPLPYTFDYEKETHSIVRIKGMRENWNPRPVPVEVREVSMLRSAIFNGAASAFASAFYTSDIDYRWERGVLEQLGTSAP
jgi:uncharacterized protein YqjF (DUF2071 family)